MLLSHVMYRYGPFLTKTSEAPTSTTTTAVVTNCNPVVMTNFTLAVVIDYYPA